MKYQLFLLVALLAAFVSSCTVTNEIHFNKDYSGDYSMEIDLSGILELANTFDDGSGDLDNSLEGMISDEQRRQMDSTFAGIEGISEPSMTIKDGNTIVNTFKFDDIESLNRAFAQLNEGVGAGSSVMGMDMGMGGMPDMKMPSFAKDGKTIIHSATIPIDEVGGIAGSDEEMAQMKDMAASMIDYTIVMSFDKKIKSVNVKSMDLLSQEKKMVKARIDMQKFTEEGIYSIDVKTK